MKTRMINMYGNSVTNSTKINVSEAAARKATEVKAAQEAAARKAEEARKAMEIAKKAAEEKAFLDNVKASQNLELQTLESEGIVSKAIAKFVDAANRFQKFLDTRNDAITSELDELDNSEVSVLEKAEAIDSKIASDVKKSLDAEKGGIVSKMTPSIIKHWNDAKVDSSKAPEIVNTSKAALPAPLTTDFVTKFEAEHTIPASTTTPTPKATWGESITNAASYFNPFNYSYFSSAKPKVEEAAPKAPTFEIVEGHLYPQLVDASGQIITTTPSAPAMDNDDNNSLITYPSLNDTAGE